MVQDKPDFLKGTGDDSEENELEDALNPETPPTTPSTETPIEEKPVEEKKEEKPGEETLPVEDKPKPKSKSKKKEETIETPPKPEETPPTPPLKKETKKEETTPPTPPETPKLIFGKYKTMEEAEKGFKEQEVIMTRALTRVKAYEKGLIVPGQDGKDTDIKKLIDNVLIFNKLPNIKNYTDEEGNFTNFEGYMKDYTKDLILAIQKSMVAGPLAVAQFTILQNSLSEMHEQMRGSINTEAETVEIENNLFTDFPILKENEDLQEVLAKAIFGEKYQRALQAKKDNKEPVELVYEDYKAIASKVIGGQTVTKETPQDTTETMKETPPLSTTIKTPVDEALADVQAMEKVKTRGQLF